MNDAELLQRYLHDGSPAAFADIVGQHLDLVYSVARRHVDSPAAAEDVAQAVFIELARHAARIKPGTPLVAWLHLVSRRTAINAARGEARRRTHEQHAAADSAVHREPLESAMKTNDSDWPGIAPLLDEAVESLNEPDRTAILLRFFENKSLREIGAALGASEDAAQKRVTRALEQLRAFFLRRGVTITAAGLASDLSAHALQVAPAALATSLASLATVSGTVIAPAAVTAAAQKLAMTAAQKTLLAAAALVLAAGIFETYRIFQQRTELATLRDRGSLARSNLATLARQLEDTRRSQQALRSQLPGGPPISSPAGEPDLAAEIRLRLARVKQLRQVIEKNPALSLPEFGLLDDDDWHEVVKEHDLAIEHELLPAVIDLRSQAKQKFADILQEALKAYLLAHRGNLPAQMADLARMFPPDFDVAILQRYELLHTGNVSGLPRRPLPFKSATVSSQAMGVPPEEQSPALIAEKTNSLLPHEDRLFIGRTGYVIVDEVEFELAGNEGTLDQAVAAFAEANAGAHPAEPEQLFPYFNPPLDATTQRRITELTQEKKRREANNPFRDLKR